MSSVGFYLFYSDPIDWFLFTCLFRLVCVDVGFRFSFWNCESELQQMSRDKWRPAAGLRSWRMSWRIRRHQTSTDINHSLFKCLFFHNKDENATNKPQKKRLELKGLFANYFVCSYPQCVLIYSVLISIDQKLLTGIIITYSSPLYYINSLITHQHVFSMRPGIDYCSDLLTRSSSGWRAALMDLLLNPWGHLGFSLAQVNRDKSLMMLLQVISLRIRTQLPLDPPPLSYIPSSRSDNKIMSVE